MHKNKQLQYVLDEEMKEYYMCKDTRGCLHFAEAVCKKFIILKKSKNIYYVKIH